MGKAASAAFSTFVALADGRYFLCVHDLLFRGGADYSYHLAVTTRPHLHSVFPPVGRAGSKSKYTLYGYNLLGGVASSFCDEDGQTLQQLEVEIDLPPQSLSEPKGSFEYRLATETGSSNPLRIFIADCQSIGRFSSASAGPSLEFTGTKGQSLWCEVYADRFGIPAATDLLLQRVSKEGKSDQRAQVLKEINGIDSGPAFRVPLNGLPTAMWRSHFNCRRTELIV